MVCFFFFTLKHSLFAFLTSGGFNSENASDCKHCSPGPKMHLGTHGVNYKVKRESKINKTLPKSKKVYF